MSGKDRPSKCEIEGCHRRELQKLEYHWDTKFVELFVCDPCLNAFQRGLTASATEVTVQ